MNKYFWTNEEFDTLKQNYGKIKIEELELLLPQRARHSIQKKAQILGLKGDYRLSQLKYKFNESYFNVPNIQNCYWAGYIAADGSINNDGSISLVSKDLEILQNIKKHTEYEGYISISKCQKYYTLRFNSSPTWIINLNQHWNITARKSNTLLPPKLSKDNLILAFIVGYMDGDGSIYTDKRGQLHFDFCGTEWVVEWIRQHISRICNISPNKITQNGTSANNKVSRWSGNKQVKYIIDTINSYTNIDWKLKRKWDINE